MPASVNSKDLFATLVLRTFNMIHHLHLALAHPTVSGGRN